MLDYAGLEALGLSLIEFVNVADPSQENTRHVAGFFRGIESGVCLFGANVSLLGDPEYLVGVMAHEVAHAFRHRHALEHEDREIEEELTDLTTVYLGSALLTGNLAERVVVERSSNQVLLSRSTGGYLSVEDMVFLLAIQLRARRCDEQAIARLKNFLGSSQWYCLNRCLEVLDLDSRALRAELGVPGYESEATQRLDLRSLPAASSKRWSRPWGHTVYAVRRVRAAFGASLGFCVGFLALPLSRDFRALTLWGLLPLLGAVVGYVAPKLRCSRCRTQIPTGARECPGCAGFVVGTLSEHPPAFDVGDHRRSRVLRVRGTRALHCATWGAVLAGFCALIPCGFGFSLGYPVAAMVAGGIIGGLYGRRLRRDVCGGSQCGATLDAFVSVCPRCLGEVRGNVATLIEAI